VGFVALGLLLVVEFTLVLWLRGQQFVSTSQAETLRPGRSTTRRLECLPSCRLCWLEDDIADPIPCCTLVDILPITRKIVGGAMTAQTSGTIHNEKSKENRNDAKGY
jgi:hypothetical protein